MSSCPIKWSNFIIYFPWLRIIKICFPVYDIKNLKLALAFKSSVFYMTKKSGQKFKYLKNKKSA